jgi:CheY-like chemotaxis protein
MAKPTVIYADDDDALRSITKEMMKAIGYDNVREHPNGALALDDIRQAVANGEPVILVTDNDMPTMSGVELVKALADEGIRVPTIMTTANSRAEDQLKEAVVADKVDRMLAKPYTMGVFKFVIDGVAKKMEIQQSQTPIEHAGRRDTGVKGVV